jgi:hypothetical protein
VRTLTREIVIFAFTLPPSPKFTVHLEVYAAQMRLK